MVSDSRVRAAALPPPTQDLQRCSSLPRVRPQQRSYRVQAWNIHCRLAPVCDLVFTTPTGK
eukprot:scaffold24310_cov43-Phaeocystis_antarctica.AAC.1